MSPFFRAIAVATIGLFAFSGLTAAPAVADSGSAETAARVAVQPLVVPSSEPDTFANDEETATSGTGEPHTFRYSDTVDSDIPAKVKKAKKKTKTLVILAYTKKKDKTTSAKVKKTFFTNVDRWMRWESSGRQGEKGKVTKWLKISKTSCNNYDAVMKKAVAKAKSSGYNPGGYTRIAVYFPKCKSLPWEGLGSVGKDRGKFYIWLNGNASLQVIAHEALHNNGLLHSASTDCKGKSWPKSTSGCSVTEYGDPFDVMGNTDIAMSASSKLEAGWLTKKQYKTIKKGSKTFTINANESASSKLKLVRVYMGSRKYLDIEYRAPGGLDTGLDVFTIDRPSLSGVQVRSVKPHKKSAAYGRTIVDVLPNNSAAAASIPAGQSWTAYNGARITVVSTSAKSAVVTVTFKAPPSGLPSVPAITGFTLASAATPTVYGTALATLAPTSGNGMPVLSYDLELSDGTTVTPTQYDALGGAVLNLQVPRILYASYQVRIRANSEIGSSDWSAWSAPLVVTDPIPVLGATSVDSGVLPTGSKWRNFAAVVTPNPTTGTAITRVVLSNTHSGISNGSCEAVLKAGTADTWVCPENVYNDYGLFPGPNTLTVQAQDANGHYATKTVNFTVGG
jgi:hypothetical protein